MNQMSDVGCRTAEEPCALALELYTLAGHLRDAPHLDGERCRMIEAEMSCIARAAANVRDYGLGARLRAQADRLWHCATAGGLAVPAALELADWLDDRANELAASAAGGAA